VVPPPVLLQLSYCVMLCPGKLQIKHKVQVRTLRATHCDSHYCAALFKYVKGMVDKLAKVIQDVNPSMVVRFASMDDKAKVSCLNLAIVLAFFPA
jgi:hypothetical protein